jgi:hypothetical protein
MCNGSTPDCEVAFMEWEKFSASTFVTQKRLWTSKKTCDHRSSAAHLSCITVQNRKKKDNGKELFQLIYANVMKHVSKTVQIHVKICS